MAAAMKYFSALNTSALNALNAMHPLKAMVCAALGCACLSAHAQETPPPAYQLAAHAAGVPSEVLYAVALTESGMRYNRQMRPWPWTLNVAGEPRRFESKQDACTNLRQTLHTVSAKRVDVGLAQINYGYHGERVNDPCDLLDPYRNLAIAADLLRGHHKPGEDWLQAIGRYHSPAGGVHATRYRASVQRQLVRVRGQRPAAAATPKVIYQ